MNGKFFLAPPEEGLDLKQLLKRATSAGAGRPLDAEGLPPGPWTPDLLADAISGIDANRAGIDLRTVQLWFQENDKGISAENVRWLARIFGCGEAQAISAWQVELQAAQSRLAEKRRARRNVSATDGSKESSEDADPSDLSKLALSVPDRKPRIPLARFTERMFSRSHLDLASIVFAGAAALGFLSYILGLHSVTYSLSDGSEKQVGFLWAPNWTFLFMLFLPLYLSFVTEVVTTWRGGRGALTEMSNHAVVGQDGWSRRVDGSSLTFWTVLLICLFVAGLLQWLGTRLFTVLEGDLETYAMDWGNIALVRPDVISIAGAIGFSGLAHLYMSLCFYLYFVGLILLYVVAQDFRDVGWVQGSECTQVCQREISIMARAIMNGTFRSTILAILIAICMKLQSVYLVSDSANIVDWLVADARSVFVPEIEARLATDYGMPNQFSSLLIGLTALAVYLHAAVRIRVALQRPGIVGGASDTAWEPEQIPFARMTVVLVVAAAAYLSIGLLSGFSILLGFGLLVSTLALFDPGLRFGRSD